MENILSIFVKAIFVENMVFAFFFGMCSYIAVSKSVDVYKRQAFTLNG